MAQYGALHPRRHQLQALQGPVREDVPLGEYALYGDLQRQRGFLWRGRGVLHRRDAADVGLLLLLRVLAHRLALGPRHHRTLGGCGGWQKLRRDYHHLEWFVALYDWRHHSFHPGYALQVPLYGPHQIVCERLWRGGDYRQCREGHRGCLQGHRCRDRRVHYGARVYGRRGGPQSGLAPMGCELPQGPRGH